MLKSIPVVLIAVIFSFFITHLMPGDPVRTMLGNKASQEQIVIMRQELHLNKPVIEQFTIWISNVLRLDLGESIFLKEPIIEIILKRTEPTLVLAIIAIVVSVALGVPMGLRAAKFHGKSFDKFFLVISLVSISIPGFLTAIMVIQMFCVNVNLFPVAGYHSIKDAGLVRSIYELSLPGLVLGVMYSGQIARMTRMTMLDVMQNDYLKTARAKGVKEKHVLNVHAFVNVVSPIILVVGFCFASLLGGAAVIEQLFNIPGIGNLLITAVLNRDYPLIQGSLLFISIIFILVNMFVDIICALINPKDRLV